MTGQEYLTWIWRQVRAKDGPLSVVEWAVLCGVTPDEAEAQLRSVAETHIEYGHPVDHFETWRRAHE